MTAVAMRRRLFREEEPEWLVWLVVLVLLAIGMTARVIVVNRATTVSEGNVSVSYPAGWTPLETDAPGAVLSVGESFTDGLLPARLTVLQLPAAEISRNAESLGDFAFKWSDDQAKDLLGYRVLSIEPLELRGQGAARVNYAYVAEPAFAAADTVPVIARGADILMRNGDTITVMRLLAEADAFESLGPTWDRMIASLELR